MDFATFKSGVAFQYGIVATGRGSGCCLLQCDNVFVTITGCENGIVYSTDENADYASNLIAAGEHRIIFLSFYGSVFHFLIHNDEGKLVFDTLSAAAKCVTALQEHFYIDEDNHSKSMSGTSPIDNDADILYAMPLRTFLSYTTPLVLKAMQMAYAPISARIPIMAGRNISISFTPADVVALEAAGGVTVTSDSVRLLAELTLSAPRP